MELRAFGDRSGLRVPPINIGAMRLPRDTRDAVDLVRYAIDRGMRYIDTSRGYGESEFVLSRALRDGYREKVILSSKWAPWITRIRDDDEPTAAGVRRRIEEQLLRLDVDYLDYYQVWNINSREAWDASTRPGGMVDGIRGAIDAGLVRRTGFTTHDSVENLVEYVKDAPWCDIILFTYNLLNRTYEPAIAAARAAGIGTIVMNPVGGGRLAGPSEVLDQLAADVGAASAAELAIRFILTNPDVTTMITGIGKAADVDANIAAVERGPFDAGRMATITAFLDRIEREKAGYCTGCKYCLPCPQGIDIPAIMNCVFDDRVWGMREHARRRYANIKGPKADACVQCRRCEAQCTQSLGIVAEMEYAAANLAAD